MPRCASASCGCETLATLGWLDDKLDWVHALF
jgi:hypothetical protein